MSRKKDHWIITDESKYVSLKWSVVDKDGSQYGTTPIMEVSWDPKNRDYLANRNTMDGIRKCLYLIFKPSDF